MSYIFSLTTESHLLTGSGEGGVLIDADVVFHSTGFPMIPARRIKGMLKESLEEVLEIYSKSEGEIEKIKTSLLGESGKPTYEGKLLFHNLMLPDWEDITFEIAKHPECGAFQPDFVKAFFTSEIQQTAVGREGVPDEIEGVAKKRSLRNYRVINPGTTFQGLLETTTSLSTEEAQFLQKAILNLRHAGTRRNRGFGKVKCTLEATQEASSTNQNPLISNSGKLSVTITTQSPVVLAEQLGEQNTVFTRKYISGNQLRGLLTNAFLRKKRLSTATAHLDSDFFELFLSNKVTFSSLSFSQAIPIPLHLHTYKQDKDKDPISVFDKKDTDHEITKPIGRAGTYDGGKIRTDGYTPKTTFNFHNSRYNRAAGRSTENDAETGIFYYESLNEGQAFHGEITGEPDLIAKLATALSTEFPAKLGRSRSAQYGSVLVKLEARKEASTSTSLPEGKYIMTLQSPLVLLNENGHPSPTVAALKKALSETLGGAINIDKAAAAFTHVEQFNAIWQAKSDKIPAFKEGSSFLMTLPNFKAVPTKLGEWTEQGFGVLRFEAYDHEAKYQLEKQHEKKEKDHTTTQTQINDSSPVIKKLMEAFKKEEKQLEVKSKAITEADADPKKYGGIKNHLIGRVEAMFQKASTQEDIDEWIKALFRANSSGKPAAESLINVGILVEVSEREFKETGIKAKFSQQGKDDLDFELTRTYWITFFQTLRKINKKNGKQ